MGKNRILTIGLIIIIGILCLMTIYMLRRNKNLNIAYNRKEREYAILKKEYEKLYDYYYAYDQKIATLLNYTPNEIWATDSSSYIIGSREKFMFSFFKKPKLDSTYFAWIHWIKFLPVEGPSGTVDVYRNCGQVDTLKPHQWLIVNPETWPDQLIVAPVKPGDSIPDTTQIRSEILIKNKW